MMRALACLWVVLAASARGQSTAEYAQRTDSLARIWRARRAAIVTDARVAAKNLPPDTVADGPFVVLTDRQHVPLARATIRALVPTVDHAYGAFAPQLRNHPFVIRSKGDGSSGETEVIQTGVADSTGELHLLSKDLASEKTLSAMWLRKVEHVLTGDLDPAFRAWLGGPIPAEPASAGTWSEIRKQLLLESSFAARRCLNNDVPRCEQALGLLPVDDPVMTLFEPRERLGLVQKSSDALKRADPIQYEACVSDGAQSACDALLRAIPPEELPSVPAMVRQHFTRFALERGGGDAFTRMASAASSPGERLQAAAAEPLDSLVAQWQTKLRAVEARSTAMDSATAISSLFWAALCCGLALRSSRWR